MFGLVVPGRPCFANFQQVGENRWFIQIPDKINGQSISELTIFALPNVPMPPLSHGFTIYISKDSNNWEFLDFLTIDKQSTHLHVPLSFDSSSSVQQSAFQNFNNYQQQNVVDQLFVGISLEPIDTINNLTCNAAGKQQLEQSQVQQLVKAIANDLFNYMSSFTKPYQVNETGAVREMLVLPTNILDTWLQKFLNKLRLNPHYGDDEFIKGFKKNKTTLRVELNTRYFFTTAIDRISDSGFFNMRGDKYEDDDENDYSAASGRMRLREHHGGEEEYFGGGGGEGDLGIEMNNELNLFDIEKMCEIHYVLPNEEIVSLIESHVLEFLFRLTNEEGNGQDLVLNYSFGGGGTNTTTSGGGGEQQRLNQIIKVRNGTFEKKSQKNRFQKKNHLVWLLMKDVHSLLTTRRKITQRELFYMNVTTFRDQIQCNRCLSSVGDVLKVDRSLLNIICMSKGYIYSNDGRGNSLLSLFENKQACVETIPGDFPSISYYGSQPSIDTVLIIEKDAIFRRLVEDKMFKLVRNCVLITGCGYPSIVTRFIVKQISSRFPNAKLYALCDFNIFGYQIMNTYKYGSVELSRHKVQQESTLKERLQWLGLTFGDVQDIPLYYSQTVSERELKLIDRHIKDSIQRKESESILKELEFMKSRKFEIEILITTKGLGFLATHFAKKISKFNIVGN